MEPNTLLQNLLKPIFVLNLQETIILSVLPPKTQTYNICAISTIMQALYHFIYLFIYCTTRINPGVLQGRQGTSQMSHTEAHHRIYL